MPSTAKPREAHPCLPQDLVEKLKSDPLLASLDSSIFDPAFDVFRHDVVKLPMNPYETDIEIVMNVSIHNDVSASTATAKQLADNLRHFRRGDRKTILHSAIMNSDVPMAYESLRLGTTIDAKDSEGVTPLFFALEFIHFMSDPFRKNSILSGQSLTRPTTISEPIDRVGRIAVLLILQHADVNAGAFGLTPLGLAVMAGKWGLVRLLLHHGAHPVPPTSLQLASQPNQERYASLLTKVQAVHPRPLRPCPCWSGKLLSECHMASKLPYPEHFLCTCEKKKTYGSCCKKRGIVIQEKWDEKTARIARSQAVATPSPLITPELQQSFMAGWDVTKRVYETSDPKRMAESMIAMHGQTRRCLRIIVELAGRGKDVDPAYWYALDKTDFFAIPWKTKVSSIEGRKRMDEWNAVIDAYIKESSDLRSAFDIEVEAKIDSHGEPLYKHCESRGCSKIQGKDIEILRRCSKCQLTLYCSSECQKKHWKAHKMECGSDNHRAQVLRSQRTLEEFAAGLQACVGDIIDSGEFGTPEEAVERLRPV